MKQIVCPDCGSTGFFHFADAYVRRVPFLTTEGKVELAEPETLEFDDRFFECERCGVKLEEDSVTGEPAKWVEVGAREFSTRITESILERVPIRTA